jgi:type IV secretion system protein VirB9
MLKRIINILIMACFYNIFCYAEIPIATDSRIKTYVYNQNDVYLVVIASGFQSSIEFDRGETIQTLSLGDQYSWSLTPMNNRLFIKPLENNIHTNMTVITNMRTYQFDVVSSDSGVGSEQAAYVIRFYYPPKSNG